MYIVVPNSIGGLPRVLNGLSDLRLEIDNLNERLVDVTLPKFKFDYTSQLDGILREVRLIYHKTDHLLFSGELAWLSVWLLVILPFDIGIKSKS